MLKEFKNFIFRGNVFDMAIGIVIGVAFGKIVTSLVDDILMPPLGLLIGHVDFSNLELVLKAQSLESKAVVIRYGVFINSVVNFIIIAFAIFFIIKQLSKFKKSEEIKTTTKQCPFCLNDIALKATRCSHCTSEI